MTWNGRDHLRRCLDALSSQTYPSSEVVAVDNGSTDGTAEMLQREYPQVRLIQNQANLGFAAANNLAIRATDTPYIATLNNDAAPEPGWLATLVAAAESDSTLGSVSSKMVFAHDAATINSCGIALDPVGIAWDLWGGYPARAVDQPREVFGACAGAALYRRAMLEDVGLFDEDFFAYLEDVDLAWRARLRGWRCVLAPGAVVLHVHSGTLGEGSALKRYLLARNKIWTIAKGAPAADLWRWLPLMAIYDVGAATFAALRQRDWASVRGRVAGLQGLPTALRKRREIQARRTASAAEVRRYYAPLAPPWDVPRRYRHLVRGQGTGARGQGTGEILAPKTLLRRLTLLALGLILPPRRPPNPQPPTPNLRIVVLRPDHLGDVLLSRPAIELVQRAAPHAAISVVVGPWGLPSLRGTDVRMATFPFPGFVPGEPPLARPQPVEGASASTAAGPARRPGNPLVPYMALLAFAARLRRERYDAALALRPDHWWGALAAAVAGIPVRIGHHTPETAPFLTHQLEPAGGEHAMDAGLRAARALLGVLGIEHDGANPPLTFHPSPGAIAEAEEWLLRHGLQGPAAPVSRGSRPRRQARVPATPMAAADGDAATPAGAVRSSGASRCLVAIHPGAGSPLKLWPPERWAAVADSLGDRAAVFLTAGAADAPLAAAIQAQAARRLPAAVGLDWEVLAALYQKADLVLGMDSGPLHLASAVGTATVSVYGPSDPRIYGPVGDPARHPIVQGTLPCVPCRNLARPPCGYLQEPPCLASVTVQAFLAHVHELLPEVAPP